MELKHFEDMRYFEFESMVDNSSVVHGIFTRHGGVSDGNYRSLNVGFKVGDQLDKVQHNIERIEKALGIPLGRTHTTWQVHGADVCIVSQNRTLGWPPPQADTLITATKGVALMMRFADCVPIILYDPFKNVLALVHAGWRGTVARTVQAGVETMRDAFKVNPADILAGIGPSIGPDCYEVGSEVLDAFVGEFDTTGRSFFDRRPVRSRLHLDLWRANEFLLRESGVVHIEIARMCTACLTEDFYSHRAENGLTGRFAMVAALT